MEKDKVVMSKVLIDEESFSKIKTVNLDECNEAILILSSLLKRNISFDMQVEVQNYIECIQQRITELSQQGNLIYIEKVSTATVTNPKQSIDQEYQI